MTVFKKHFGVYGVLYIDGCLLCINKYTGPYKNRYDLPGGSQKINESLVQTLYREILEESGYSLNNYSNVRCYDSFIQEDGTDIIVHHIFVLYDIEAEKVHDKISELTNETNDSSGISWVNVKDLTEENSSPVIIKLLKELNNNTNKNLFDAEKYNNWIVRND